jgi:hypothetical protein
VAWFTIAATLKKPITLYGDENGLIPFSFSALTGELHNVIISSNPNYQSAKLNTDNSENISYSILNLPKSIKIA